VLSSAACNAALDNKTVPSLQSNELSLIRNKKGPVSIYIFQPAVLSVLEEFIFQAMFRLENKIKILSRTEKQIFKEKQINVEMKKK
jgi:hypothetical protein